MVAGAIAEAPPSIRETRQQFWQSVKSSNIAPTEAKPSWGFHRPILPAKAVAATLFTCPHSGRKYLKYPWLRKHRILHFPPWNRPIHFTGKHRWVWPPT